MEADRLVMMNNGFVKLIVSITRSGSDTLKDDEDADVGHFEATLLPGSGWSICGKYCCSAPFVSGELLFKSVFDTEKFCLMRAFAS